MNLSAEIERRLTTAFSPVELVVENESHRHAGHAGDDGSGESHFRLRIRADRLAGMSRIDRHRAVHAALGSDITGRIHALAIDAG